MSSHGRGGERREKNEGGEKKVGGQRETRTVSERNGRRGVDDGKMVIKKNG